MTLNPARGTRLLALSSLALIVGCAATPPREAIPQKSSVGDPPVTFAGSYDVKANRLTLTADDQPIMRGSFPPYTPVLNLNGEYGGTPVRAECYFSSVLSEKSGLVGVISGAIQSSKNKTSDTCRMLVDAAPAATLNF